MRFIFLICILIVFQYPLFSQKKWSIGLDVGSTVGLSNFIPTEGFSPYFISYTEPDFAYGLSVKYYLDENHLIEFTMSDYIRFVGARIKTISNNQNDITTNLNADVSALYILNYHKRVIKPKKSKFNLWLYGGIGLEQIKDRFTSLRGFPSLVLYDAETKEGIYPRLNVGVTTKLHFGKSILGLKLVGGIGFIHHSFYFYEGISDGVIYNGVVRYKGDYLGLLATYEYSFNKFKVRGKKKKRKRKKKR